MSPRSESSELNSNPQGPVGDEAAPDDFEAFCQKQILRVKKLLEGQTPTRTPSVNATPVSHAVGKRKPSLSQTELEGMPWPPSLRRKT